MHERMIVLHTVHVAFCASLNFVHILCRGDLACNIALDAVRTIARDQGDTKEIDIKNYAKVEKVHNILMQVRFQDFHCEVERLANTLKY